jgi:hypothetical protein
VVLRPQAVQAFAAALLGDGAVVAVAAVVVVAVEAAATVVVAEVAVAQAQKLSEKL